MISVCITTHNGEKYIKEQIDSILPQISSEDEIIVSDDNSTDKTLDIVTNFKDDRIKILHHKQNDNKFEYPFYKVTKNFENALLHARGEIIFLADQDDVWLENKVKKILPLLEKKILVVHDCFIVDYKREIINSSYFNINRSKSGVINNIINCSYLGCCMAFRKELLESALPFPQKPIAHDIWLGLLAELTRNVLFYDEKLIYYRRHDTNVSTSSNKSKFSLKIKISYRLILIFELIKRLINKR